MQINWKVRLNNPLFYTQVVLAILLPILAYMGLTVQDLTTWGELANVLINAVSNPYVLGLVVVSVYNAVSDPTTKGVFDSKQAMTYVKPRSDKL